MTRAAEVVLAAIAVLAALVFAAREAGLADRMPSPTRDTRAGKYFHEGKGTTLPPPDPACQNDKCHGALPHRKSVAEAGFRNMHIALAECLACHGKDPGTHWGPGNEGRGERKVRYAAGSVGSNPHDALGRPAACRACHSDAGRAALQQRGVSGLGDNFGSPIALRMMEERGKKWIMDDIR